MLTYFNWVCTNVANNDEELGVPPVYEKRSGITVERHRTEALEDITLQLKPLAGGYSYRRIVCTYARHSYRECIFLAMCR